MIGSAWRQIRDCMLYQRNLIQPHTKKQWGSVPLMFQLVEDEVPWARLSNIDFAAEQGIHVGAWKPVVGERNTLENYA